MNGTSDGAAQPMTVQFENQDRHAGVLWIWLSTVSGFLKPTLNKLLGGQPEAGTKEHVAEVSL